MNIRNPLHVKDCWGDSNIGAAGKDIIEDSGLKISQSEKMWVCQPNEIIDYEQSTGHAIYNMPLSEVEQRLFEKPFIPMSDYECYPEKNRQWYRQKGYREQLSTIRLVEFLEVKGIDGLCYNNYEEGGVSWVIFRPEQCLMLPFRLSFGREISDDSDSLRDYPLPSALQPLTEVRQCTLAPELPGIPRIFTKISKQLGF